jgi:hypothetical protein
LDKPGVLNGGAVTNELMIWVTSGIGVTGTVVGATVGSALTAVLTHRRESRTERYIAELEIARAHGLIASNGSQQHDGTRNGDLYSLLCTIEARAKAVGIDPKLSKCYFRLAKAGMAAEPSADRETLLEELEKTELVLARHLSDKRGGKLRRRKEIRQVLNAVDLLFPDEIP